VNRSGSLDPIFANHLQFFRRHRGDFHVAGDGVYIVAEAPGVTSWTPLSDEAALPPGFDAVRLLPESGHGWPRRLEQMGFAAAETLSYQAMALTNAIARQDSPAVRIAPVSSTEDALAFAAVQAAAFLEEPDEGNDWWRAFFPLAAMRNYVDPDQRLLTAFCEEQAAAVLLLLYTGDCAGIYAVATRPKYRRRGLSAALLKAAADDARERGAKCLVLQAMLGSVADGFYRRAGFEERYRSTVWRRAP
jgi:GNAT superfamily N-acetyltransferase